MGKPNSERQREYRARRNADPERRETYLRRERERWKKDIEAGKKKTIKDLSYRAKQLKRKRWRLAKHRQRMKELEPLDNLNNTPSQIPDDQNADQPIPESSSFEDMSSVWQQEPSGYSPCVEIDSSSVRCKDRLASPAWLKQEQDELRIIKWEHFQTGPSPDAVQDNTPSSAMSAASHTDSLPPRVLLTITKLQCMLESKQERIAALERQVEDLMQDRKFLRSQIENLTSNRPMPTFASPSPLAEAPKHSKVLHSENKSRKRERASCSSSNSSDSGSEESESSEVSAASSEHRRKKHHKDKKKSKKGKDYSRKRATGVQYVIHRYKQVLSAFVKKKSMSEAFRHLGIDRNTIANTASIAELHLAGKDMVPLVGMFRQGEETLVNYAQRCTLVIDSDADLSRKIDQMKANGELLPISGKRSRGLHSHLQPLGGAADSILIG